MKKLFDAEVFNDLYNKTMKAGVYSMGAGDFWEPDVRPEDFSKLANQIVKDHLIKRDGCIYVDSGVTLNGEKLFRRLDK